MRKIHRIEGFITIGKMMIVSFINQFVEDKLRYEAVKNKRVCWEEVTLWDSFVEERTYNIMLNAYSDELYLHRRMALFFCYRVFYYRR
ncbi:hypothetical protein [Bartonella sp. OC16QHHD]|uniref:hypothetical protein n=1 Tax=Bartonella sp. OC16QHHD TaxID=3243562 RepID=UPI0035CFD4DB